MMSEEPRRSVRATKGTHKGLELLDQPAESSKKRSGKKGGSKKSASQEVEQDEDDGIIRCICGAIEQDDDTDEEWICCDNCEAWQHNVCMAVGVPLPEKYFCEQCKPENHKELLDAIARGEKPWEQRRQTHEEAQEKKPKKGGKKAKGKRVSDSKSELSHASKVTPDPSAETPSNVKKEKRETVSRSGIAKRKARDGSHEKDPVKEPQAKVRKTSPASTKAMPAAGASNIEALDKQRHGPAKLILRGMEHSMTTAQKKGTYVPVNGTTAEQKALQLTLEIERAAFDAHPREGYVIQAKSLGFNLKANQELCDRLLSGDLTPSALASMTSDEMRSKALQKETAEMQARNDKASIMVTDDGPRIRRTHKGEEVIEDSFVETGTESMPAPRRRSMLDPNGSMAARSRENSPGEQVELPEDIDSYRSRDDIRGHAMPKGSVTNNNNNPTTPSGLRKSSMQASDFDFNKVISSVGSPSASQPARRVSGPTPSQNQTQQKQGPGEDPEIDRLLEDDGPPDSPPYSPSQYDADPSIVWRGSLEMASIAHISATAKHIAGANLGPKGTNVVSWSQLMPKDLKIAGRIEQGKASEYLCGLKYSSPTDIVVVALSPSGEVAQQEFSKIYNYFLDKKRFGVIGNKGFANVRDTYLIPVPAGTGNIPEFMQALEDCSFPETRTEISLLVVFVVRNEQTGPQSDMSRNLDGAGSPATPYGHPQRHMSTGSYAPTMSPMAPQGGFGSPAAPMPPQNLPVHLNPDDALRARREAQARGEKVASQILGDLFRAPTVQFLLPQAHIMHPREWQVIADIYRQEPKTQTDLQQLSALLEQKNNASPKL